MTGSTYSEEFYARRRALTLHSARRALTLLRKKEKIESVVDVGCGTGTWLAAAREFGATRTIGYEGRWLKREMLDDSAIELRHIDLATAEIAADERFDLAVSLEVAEHLPEDRAISFVGQLCGLSDTVLFSAAVPFQGGRAHVNEQWQSYWAKKFACLNYFPCDLIRRHLWEDEQIPFYYRQNLLIYRKRKSTESSTAVERPSFILDIVHPDLLSKVANQRPKTSAALAELFRLPRAAIGKIRKRFFG